MDIPARLGKYTVTALLGRGAMGVVYKGFDPGIQRTVALKTIRREFADAEHAHLVERFKREAQAAGRLQHSGIVGVYDYGEEGDVAYIAMEYVQGHDLAEYFAVGTRFSTADAVSIVAQLLDALSHAHAQGVVHRDIKPPNLILTSEGRLKVADFGIARLSDSELTVSGAVLGTPSYMAPEQYMGEAIDARADLFAAGVLLFQLLTGAKPFQGGLEQVAYKVCHEPTPRLSSFEGAADLSRFDRIIDRALAKRPDDRFPSAAAFRSALLIAHSEPAAPTVSEETRLRSTPVPAPVGVGSASTPPPRAPASGGSTVPMGWDVDQLKRIERELAVFVGPFARLMVRKAAAATSKLDVLYTALAEGIEDARDRQRFLTGAAARTGATQASAGTVAPPTASAAAAPDGSGAGIPAELVAQATEQLAPFLGPIAKVVTKRAAARSADPRSFYLLVADNLTDASERARFLRAVGVEA